MSASIQRIDIKKNVPLVDRPESDEGKDEMDSQFKNPKSYVHIVDMSGNNIAHEFNVEPVYKRMRSFEDLDEAIEAVVITILEYSRHYWNIIEKLKLSRETLKKDLAIYVMDNRTSDGFFDDKKFKINSSDNPSNNRSNNRSNRNSRKSPNINTFNGWHLNVYTIPVFEKARDYMPVLDD